MDGLGPEVSSDVGQLVLVVGASGVGKDSILDEVRKRLDQHDQFVFVRRFITRPAEAGGEDHIEISCESFARDAAAGRFSLYWHAHGNDYGLPKNVLQNVKAGKTVLANASRTIIPEARNHFRNMNVINITASRETIATRLKGRGRETDSEIEKRLARDIPIIEGARVYELPNNETLSLAADRFEALLRLISLGFYQDNDRLTFVS